MDRVFCSTEVNEEDLQDYEVPMVVIGYDVVSLYPNMKVDQVSEKVLEAIMMTKITWRAVDYMEAARYVILNLTAEEVMESGLKRILPWRRGKRGNKPGMKGEGP